MEKYARSLGVTIGDECDIQDVSFGSEPYLIEIGNHVQIINGTKLFTHGGGWVLQEKYPNIDFFGKIKINDNVYIGNNSLVMLGVTIGTNVVVAAGSVVTKSIPAGSIVGGNSARIIDDVAAFEKKVLPFNVDTKVLNKADKKSFLIKLTDNRFLTK